MHQSLAIALAAFVLTACQSASQVETSPVPAVAAAPAALSGPAKAGFELSEALCSGCHAIKAGTISPNPMSPTFAMIANSAGLTRETLSEYLRDSHNYPETMNFEVVEEDSYVLAAYIITLRSDDYTPPIQ
jgi:mono/diheme cytochrome c family protein